MSGENTNFAVFDESVGMYRSFMVIFLAGQIGIIIISYYIATIIIGLALAAVNFYLVLVSIAIQYKWKMNLKLHLIPIIAITIAYVSEFNKYNSNMWLFFIILPVFLITGLFMSSYVYTIECEYNKDNGVLKLVYNKIFLKINKEYIIPQNSVIHLHSLTNPGFVRANMFHKISIDHKNKIDIASLNANGFKLISKIYKLLQPYQLNIDLITKTNEQIVFPRTNKVLLSIPKYGNPPDYYPIHNLKLLMNQPTFKSSFPKIGSSAKLSAYILLLFIISTPIVIITLLVKSILGLIEPAPLEAFLFLSAISIFLLVLSVIIGSRFIAVVFGKLEIEMNDEFIELKYSVPQLKPVKRKIHVAFNPLIRIYRNYIDLVILGNLTEIFYEHRIGTISEDDLQILNKEN